jgi:anti-sigma factor RsiW
MDHSQFKANQTAAVYVADGLDASTQEAFEMHMMACPECVEDVETWRAIKVNIPARVRPASTFSRRIRAGHGEVGTWRLAASVVLAGIVGVTGGWFTRAARGPDLDSAQSVFFNMPALERGGDDCRAVRLAPDSKLAVVRVPALASGDTLIAVDSEKQELPSSSYFVRTQPDGSALVRIETRVLVDRAVHLETRKSDGSTDPVGCITGEIAP